VLICFGDTALAIVGVVLKSIADDPDEFWMKPCRHDFITQCRKLDVARQTHTERELLVFRTVDDIVRVRKKASRYKRNGATRRIMVGEGEDEVVEWWHGFEIIDNICAMLRHYDLFATVGLEDIYFAPFTAGLRHVKRIRNVSLRDPDLLPSLEGAGVLESRGSIFDGGAPGGNGYFYKVYVNAAAYVDVVDELWIFRDRLADFIRRRVLVCETLV
jgi:hypothetical protein